MGLLQRIENMRKKPEAQRERIVVVSAICITAVLFLFWVFDFSMTTSSVLDSSVDAAPSPIGIMVENMKAVFGNAVDAFKSIGSGGATSTPTTPTEQ